MMNAVDEQLLLGQCVMTLTKFISVAIFPEGGNHGFW
jgi:hypothetical protein